MIKIWTYERCKEEALKYNTKRDFREHSLAYSVSCRNKWIDEICSHMIVLQKPKGYWNDYNICKEEALKYETKSDFNKNCSRCYKISTYNGWIDDICSHMIEIKKPKGYWNNYELCKEQALKYLSKSEFQKKSRTAYKNSLKYGWLNEICSHMEQVGDLYKRLVYVYEFSDKSCYVGLTSNKNRRHRDHMKIENNSPVSIHKEKIGTEPVYILLSDYIEATDAQQLEHDTIEKYKNEGWDILNKGKTGKNTGSLGGTTIKWTYDACKEEALKHTSFKELPSGSYKSIIKNGWKEEISKYANYRLIKKWDYNSCKEEALKYSTKTEFSKKYYTCYSFALNNGFLDEICEHMVVFKNPSI